MNYQFPLPPNFMLENAITYNSVGNLHTELLWLQGITSDPQTIILKPLLHSSLASYTTSIN